MVGIAHIFVKDFAKHAHPLIYLTRKGVSFKFSPQQILAQEELKHVLIQSLALKPINYSLDALVILAMDASFIAVGYYLVQCDADNPKKQYYSRFGSTTLNSRESQFSQAKLKIYGLFRALRATRLYLIGCQNLIGKVDAKYIQGMLSNLDIAPSASINCWIILILMFHFTLVHVPGKCHGPDGLSWMVCQSEDSNSENDDGPNFDDWVDRVYGFLHFINNPLVCSSI